MFLTSKTGFLTFFGTGDVDVVSIIIKQTPHISTGLYTYLSTFYVDNSNTWLYLAS